MRGQRTKGWRRVASAIWRQPDDPQIYGLLEVDATALVRFEAGARASGAHLTLTHLVGRALAHALREVPDLNVVLRRGRKYPRPSVDVFFVTAVGGGRDLTGAKIEFADRKSAIEIARELSERAAKLRRGPDRAFSRSKRLTERLPFFALHPLLRFLAWLAGDRQVDLPGLGLPARPFGSAMISSVGMLGLPVGFSPLAWTYKVPMLVVVGMLEDKPVAKDGRVVIRPMLPICATIDHRYADGWHVAQLLKAFRAYLDAPEQFEPALPGASGSVGGRVAEPRAMEQPRP
jgi:pyruvate/2-oxoglutarate dehydrogenase complex dihydrolipoamide acyltransferase (E2) component